MTPYEWIVYQNSGATRNRPINPQLAQAFSFLPDLGLTMEVFSGGQPGIGSGQPRVGSTRHDHGNAADVFFSRGGKRLDWSNPEDLPIFQEIVRRAKSQGVTGFGAGTGYMQPGSMHVGFGSPAVWGAGGKGANAPGWLRDAYYDGGQAVAADTMTALGKPQAGLIGEGNQMQVSTKSGPRGLLAMDEPDQSGLLSLFGQRPQWGDKANDIGAVLLAMSGSPAAAPVLEMVQDRKKDKREAQRANKTLEWLQQNGRGDLAEAVASGALTANDAARIAMTPEDPMQALQVQKAQLEIDRLRNPQPDMPQSFVALDLQAKAAGLQPGTPEYQQFMLAGGKGASSDPNVQSSQPLPDQSGVMLVMRDGSVMVRTAGDEVISGQAALDFVQKAQERAADYQRSIYGARREGTLEADTTLGESAAAAGARGTAIGKAQGEAITGEGGAVATAQNALSIIQEIKNDPALPGITGMIQGRLPPVSQAGTDLNVKVEQLKGKAFLEAFESLKGGGAITEREGQAAQAAIARLDRAQSTEAYVRALSDLEMIIRQGMERAQNSAAKARGVDPAPAAPATGGVKWRVIE